MHTYAPRAATILVPALALTLWGCAVPAEMPTGAAAERGAFTQSDDLAGEWVIEKLDEQALAQPITLTGSPDALVWEPACAGQSISYRTSGDTIEFYRPESATDGQRIVCKIAYPQDLPRVLDTLEGTWDASRQNGGGVMLQRADSRIVLEPRSAEALATLAGEWRVAGIDGEEFDEFYTIALNADEDEIWWEPRCAGVSVQYRLSGTRFEVAGPPIPQPPKPGAKPSQLAPVCAIGQPPRLNEVMAAIRAAERIERTPDNGIEFSGNGRSVTLFRQ